MIPEADALMARMKSSGTLIAFAEILADTVEAILALDEAAVSKTDDKGLKARCSRAFDHYVDMADQLVNVMAHLPCVDLAGAAVQAVVLNEHVDRAHGQTIGREDGLPRRLVSSLNGAQLAQDFMLAEVLALPQATLARRIAKRYVSPNVLDEAERRVARSPR